MEEKQINEVLTDLTKVLENLATPAVQSVATTDENLSVDSMFQQSRMPSLGRQIFSVVPMHGPTAALFNLKKKPLTNDIELLRTNVAVYPENSILTGLTQEVVQDLKSQYGKEANNIIGKLLRGLANDDENIKTQAFLSTHSLAGANLVLSNRANAELNLFEITQRVQELVLQSNIHGLRTYEAYAVLPYSVMGGIMALSKYAGGDEKERGLFIASIGQTKFYVNPDPLATIAYVGLKSTDNSSKSSAVFSPYQSTIVEAVRPNSGDIAYNIFNRYAITASPLHVLGEEMMHSFAIV